MQLLTTVDADEVSPVRRAANRKRVILKEDGEVQMETEIADIMAVPWAHEGKMIDDLRKEDADESVVKAAVGAMRLLTGIADELPDGVREAVEKLGSEIYTRSNPPLNTTSVSSAGDLTGSSYGSAKDGAAPKQTDLEGSGRDGELSGSGSAPKIAADAPDDNDEDDPPKKGKRKLPAFLSKASGRKPQGESPGDEPDDQEPDADPDDNDAVEKGDPVADTHAVPIQKEDGSWDLSGVPDSSRPFYEAMIQKADETAVKLEKAETDLAETREALRTKEIIAKADTQFQAVGARDDIVGVLKEAGDKLSPEGYESLVSLLSAANERITTGDLFKEAGYTGGASGEGGDAWAKIEKAADDLVEKATEGISKAQAVERVLRTPEGAALYSAYMRETGLGVS